MNEIDVLREFRADIARADDDARAAIRARALQPKATRKAVRRRWAGRAALAAAAVAALAAVGVTFPFGGGRPTILERARAAIGDGPVLHVVLRDEWGGELVDLRTGSPVRRLHGEREVWYDPSRGLHEVSRFNGAEQGDALYPPERLPRFLAKTYAGIADGYRRALESGKARILEQGVVDGIAVYWVRVDAEWLPDVADGKLHEWAHDVAISRETFEPVYFRETRDGEPGPETGARVLKLETLAAGEGDFTARPNALEGLGIMQGRGDEIGLAEVSDVLGRPALWLGRELAGLPLARVNRFEVGVRAPGAKDWDRSTGVELVYGSLFDAPGAKEPSPDFRHAYVSVIELPRYHPALIGGPGSYRVPEGTALVNGPHAYLRQDGLVISIGASSRELAIAAARALEPVPG